MICPASFFVTDSAPLRAARQIDDFDLPTSFAASRRLSIAMAECLTIGSARRCTILVDASLSVALRRRRRDPVRRGVTARETTPAEATLAPALAVLVGNRQKRPSRLPHSGFFPLVHFSNQRIVIDERGKFACQSRTSPITG